MTTKGNFEFQNQIKTGPTMAESLKKDYEKIRKEGIRESFSEFENVEHRLEFVANIHGIEYVNDSKATNVNSTWYALESMDKPVIWIAGGLAKGASMGELVKRCASRIKAVILIGEDRELIAKAVEEHLPKIELVRVDQKSDAKTLMSDVVSAAIKLAQPGDTVLLAPACASMDQFDSYVQRGQLFSQAVKAQV